MDLAFATETTNREQQDARGSVVCSRCGKRIPIAKSVCMFDVDNSQAVTMCRDCARKGKEDKENLMTEIKIHYIRDVERITKITKGDWIDLRSGVDISLKAGEFTLIPLGVSMKLPEGYEALMAPRSSTFKNFGIIQTNSIGVIDESYSGTNDEWMMPVYAIRDTEIHRNDRICQFRLIRHQPETTFVESDSLDGTDRGGFGSTGKA